MATIHYITFTLRLGLKELFSKALSTGQLWKFILEQNQSQCLRKEIAAHWVTLCKPKKLFKATFCILFFLSFFSCVGLLLLLLGFLNMRRVYVEPNVGHI